MDLFGDENHYFGFNEYAIPREEWDVNFNALYEGDLFSSIQSHSEDISLEHIPKYGHQCRRTHSNAWYSYLTAPFLLRHETIGYNQPIDDSTADLFEGSPKEEINHSFPRHSRPELPFSVVSEHEFCNLLPDGVPANVMSDMFQLPDTLKADAQFAELEKKITVQRKQEKKSKKSKGKSSGNMNSRNFTELYSIRRSSGKRDRHSKVLTSRGPRDRRMRLPVETAIKFFGVQDRLGFDQPSKTIEWLIQKSRSAIDQLFPSPLDVSARLNTDSHYSLAFLHHDRDRTDRARTGFVTGSEKKVEESDSLCPTLLTEPSIVKQQSRSRCKRDNPRKTGAILAALKTARRSTHNTRLKELRSKARERARERTKEKRNSRGRAGSASPHMKHTTALKVEGFNLQEKNASTSSKNTLNTLETSLNRLIGFSSITGISLPAEDSVKVFPENLHLRGHSNLSLDYSRNQMQCLAQTVAQCYEDQLDRSVQSAGSFSGLCSTTFLRPRCLFSEAPPLMNKDFRTKIPDLCVDYSLVSTNSELGHGTTFYVGPNSHEQWSIIDDEL